MTSKIIIPKLKPTTQPLNRPLTPLVSPSVYGTSLMDMFRHRRTGAFNIHDIENFADEYWETEDIKIPEGLDRFLVNRCPESDKELALWMYVCLQNNGLISPFTIRANPMQPNSNSHLDFIADAFFERVGDCIVLGNRFGGKTLMFAALMFMEALFKPGIELAHLAAIRDQAQNCYTYFLKFANHPLFAHLIKGKPTMSKAVFKNESVVKILIGTVTGVNSPHPCKANIDEAELLPWAILQEAMNMATSTVTARGAKSYKQATRITSTRKKSTGTMQRLLEEAEDRGFKVYKWNVWDTIQRCLIPEDPAIIPVVDEFNDNQIVNVPQSCMGCPMMQMEPPRCLGKARMSNGGVVHLDDIRAKVRNLDNEVWMAQHECSKPGTKDLIYYMFNKGTHVINYEDFLRAHGMEVAYAEFSAVGGTYGRKVAYCPDLPVYAAQDAGYNCPATIFIQEIEDVLYVFDEIRVDRIAPSIYIQDYLLPAHVEYGVEYWICDPNGITLYSDMEVAGLYIVPASNPVEPGIEAVAARLGANQIYFDKSCINCINDLSKYSRDSYGNIRRKTIFHYADCLRYLCMEFVAFSQVLDTVY